MAASLNLSHVQQICRQLGITGALFTAYHLVGLLVLHISRHLQQQHKSATEPIQEDSNTYSISSIEVSMSTLTDDSDYGLTAVARFSQQRGTGLTVTRHIAPSSS